MDGQQPLSDPMAVSSFSSCGNAVPLLENSVRQKDGGIQHEIGRIKQSIFTFGAKYQVQAFSRFRQASYRAASITPVASIFSAQSCRVSTVMEMRSSSF